MINGKRIAATVLTVALAVGTLFSVGVTSKAAEKKDYSKYDWTDAYNMTYEEIVKWGQSYSNGKTENQNKNTSAEFTNLYLEKTENNNSITLCFWFKDKANSGVATVLRMAEASENAMNDSTRSFDDALGQLLGNGVLKEKAKENKYVQGLDNFTSTIMQLDAAAKAYQANRVKYYFVFNKDSTGKVYTSDKPSLVLATELYSNHETEYKDGTVYTQKSNAFTFKNNKKACYNHYQTVLYYDGGIWYWLAAADPNVYSK